MKMKTKEERKEIAWEEYKKIVEPAEKEYNKIRNLAYKNYEKIENPAYEKYKKVIEEINNEPEEIPEIIEQNGRKYRLVKTFKLI